MAITQFQGESAYHAFVEHNALDIEEEQEFLEWCKATGLTDVQQLVSPDSIQEIYENYLLATSPVMELDTPA